MCWSSETHIMFKDVQRSTYLYLGNVCEPNLKLVYKLLCLIGLMWYLTSLRNKISFKYNKTLIPDNQSIVIPCNPGWRRPVVIISWKSEPSGLILNIPPLFEKAVLAVQKMELLSMWTAKFCTPPSVKKIQTLHAKHSLTVFLEHTKVIQSLYYKLRKKLHTIKIVHIMNFISHAAKWMKHYINLNIDSQ